MVEHKSSLNIFLKIEYLSAANLFRCLDLRVNWYYIKNRALYPLSSDSKKKIDYFFSQTKIYCRYSKEMVILSTNNISFAF